MKSLLKLAAVSSIALMSGAQAATLTSFSDDFENDTVRYGETTELTNWNIIIGSADVVNGAGSPTTAPHACTTGNCIDLDGSTSKAATMITKDRFAAGTYEFSFDLSGSNRWWSPEDTMLVSFGDYRSVFTLDQADTWSTLSAVTVHITDADVANNTSKIIFSHLGADNAGILIDNVSVSAVPVPAAAFLFAPALLGFMGLRRKAQKAA